MIGVDGVTIGAVKGALDGPLEMAIVKTSLPALALPGGAKAHGSPYQIGADQDIYTKGTETFILGLPVPAGTPTTNLGSAVYEPADGDDPENWFILTGLYDADHNLMLVTLPYLSMEGRTAVLVEHAGLESPPNNPPVAAAATNSTTATGFNVRCVVKDELEKEFCELDKQLIEEKFKEDLVDLTGMGYPDPLIKVEAEFYGIDNPTVSQSNTYIIILTPDCRGEEGFFGIYLAKQQQLSLCTLPMNPLLDLYKYTIRHELYHAMQAAFPATLDDKLTGKQEKWISEGLASASEVSTKLAMERTPWRDLHYVDRSLKDLTYRSQDFWVFLGLLPPGSGLDRFINLFKQGATSEDVFNFIGSKDGFRNQYWRWVKNQLMVEDSINFGGELGQPCAVQSKVVQTMGSYDLFNDGSYPSIPAVAKLGPLTSHVVKLVIDPQLEGFGQLTLWVNNPAQEDPDIRYKIYVDGETCTSIPDGRRTLRDITAAKDYYVVIGNTDNEKTIEYNIFFD